MADDNLNKYPTSLDGYILKNQLGQGTYGSVLTAKITTRDERVALKVIALEQCEIEEVMQELTILKMSKHPNVIEVFASFTENDKLYIVTALCKYGSFAQIIASAKKKFTYPAPDGLFKANLVLGIAKQVLEGLKYLHENHVIHRDIKSENLFLSIDDYVKIGDFGVSSIKMESVTVIGTPCWMAPEVINEQPYGTEADIWSLGVTIIELSTGVPPFHGKGMTMIMQNITRGPPPTFDDVSEDHKLSVRGKKEFSDVSDLIKKMLVKDQSQRPSAAELLHLSLFKSAKKPKAIVGELRKWEIIEDISKTNADFNFENDLDGVNTGESKLWSFGDMDDSANNHADSTMRASELDTALHQTNPFNEDRAKTPESSSSSSRRDRSHSTSKIEPEEEVNEALKQTDPFNAHQSSCSSNSNAESKSHDGSKARATPYPSQVPSTGQDTNPQQQKSGTEKESEVVSALRASNPWAETIPETPEEHADDGNSKRQSSSSSPSSSSPQSKSSSKPASRLPSTSGADDIDPSQTDNHNTPVVNNVVDSEDGNPSQEQSLPLSLSTSTFAETTGNATMKSSSNKAVVHVKNNLIKIQEFLQVDSKLDPATLKVGQFKFHLRIKKPAQDQTTVNFGVTITADNPVSFATKLAKSDLLSCESVLQVAKAIEHLVRNPADVVYALGIDASSPVPPLDSINFNVLQDNVALVVLVGAGKPCEHIPRIYERAVIAIDAFEKKKKLVRKKSDGDKHPVIHQQLEPQVPQQQPKVQQQQMPQVPQQQIPQVSQQVQQQIPQVTQQQELQVPPQQIPQEPQQVPQVLPQQQDDDTANGVKPIITI
eukprot:m.31226 g.31226  ORF g.31226 m.31226 type:complete len:827 (-) comp6297_c0_seq1:128-2608(-)